LAAVALRPQLVGIGPLLPSIQRNLHVSHAVAGLLGTIPILCMGLFAPTAPFLSGRVGSRHALTVTLVLVGGFGIVRLLPREAVSVILLTLPVGIGMAIANAAMPVAVKERFADRPGFATGVYTTGIAIGSGISAALAVPLAHAFGGWRAPLYVFAGGTIGLAVLWTWLTRIEPPHVRVAVRPLRLPFHRALAWRMVAAFFFMSATFYGLNAWLPDAYVEHGWSQSSAGALLGVLNLVMVPCGFLISWIGDHIGTRRLWLTVMAATQVVALVGVVVAPGAGWLWATLLGAATGSLFPLTMTLPLDAAETPAEVAALTGMMLGFGYTLSATAPLVLGAIRDLSGGFHAVILVLLGTATVLLLVDASFTPERLAAGRSSDERRLAAASS
jgi:CP family cyanate transporter-like MFS transporter